jgi:hypothetical protein
MNEDKINKLFQIIESDKVYKDHLFVVLAGSQKPPIALLKPLYDKGYFNPEFNPEPIEAEEQKGYFRIPQWDVLGYLEKIASYLSKNPSNEHLDLLQKILEAIFNFRKKNGERIDNSQTDWLLIKIIFSLPVERISASHLEFIRTALNSKWGSSLISSELQGKIFPLLTTSNRRDLLLAFLDIVLDYKKVVKSEEWVKFNSIWDTYWLRESLAKHTVKIAEICSLDAASIGIRKMEEIITTNSEQFSYVQIPTIEKHEQNSFPDRYECQLTYFVRDILAALQPTMIKETVLDLLGRGHSIFKRMAFHFIGDNFGEFKDLFWGYRGNPLEIYSIKREMYVLLEKNVSSFENQEIERIVDWIENKEYHVPTEYDEAKKSKYLAYYKKEWLSSLLASSSTKVKIAYAKYDTICPDNPKHPGFDFWSGSFVGTVSPYSAEELVKKENAEIAQLLRDFKGNSGWDNPSKEGLSDTLKFIVAKNPPKFYNDLFPFIESEIIYHSSILYGFLDAVHAKSELNWKNILDFADKVISVDNFWTIEFSEEGYNYREWIVSAISDLINEGSRNDEYLFDIKLFPYAKKLLFTFAEKVKSRIEDDNDIVNRALNSCKGKIFTALINLSCRYSRANNLPKNSWEMSIKDEFTRRLDRRIERSLEYYAVLGEYLPNLLYLDENWVWDNINRIFPKEDKIYWRSAFSGYLFFSSRLYISIYKKLKENTHYEFALRADFSDVNLIERIVQHICIAYLEDIERLEDKDSLITKLLESNNALKINSIINLFWMQRTFTDDKLKRKIKPLWKKIAAITEKNRDNIEFKKISANLIKWLSLVELIDDDIYSWLLVSVQYLKIGLDSSYLVEYLLQHLEKTPKLVAGILLATIENGFYPIYDQDNVIKIVDFLFTSQRESAIKICNLYQLHRIYFLRETFEKRRKPGET